MTNALRKAMLSTICMLVVAVLSLTGATYAWFSMGTTGTVEGINMTVSNADGGLQLSVASGASADWKSKLELTDAGMQNMMPVSTIDAETFYSATVHPDDPTQIKTVADTSNFWSTSFFAKNTGYQDIVVTLDSDVFTDSDTTDTRDSSAAARIAVFTKKPGETSYTLEYIWGEGDENQGIKDASGENYFVFNGESANETYVAAVDKLVKAANQCTFELPGLKTVTTGEGDDAVTTVEEQVVEIKVVVWVEGQDAQCVNQNASSGFSVKLNFNSVVKPADENA